MKPINWKRVWEKYNKWLWKNWGDGDALKEIQRLVNAELREAKAKKGKKA